MSNEFRKEIQNDAVNELLKHKSGTANVAMRLGKTILGLKIASNFNKVLVSYPIETIKQGWLSDAEEFGFDISNTTFTTHLSLKKHNLFEFDCVILDEIHEISIANFEYISSNIPKRLYGLTATPPNRGEKKQYFNLYCPIRYSKSMDETTGITNKDYEIIVHLVDPSEKRDIKLKSGKFWSEKAQIEFYTSKYQTTKSFSMMLMLIRAIQNSKSKFEYFKKLASKLDRGLLFLETINQCDNLPYPSVHSKNKESDYNLEQFKEGKIAILSSIGQLKAGITFKNLNTCIILHCYSSNNKAIQKIGRALNYVEGEKAIIHIICLNNTIDAQWVQKGLADLDQSKIKWIKII
jgi:superfamily II DNA or RNA helicase